MSFPIRPTFADRRVFRWSLLAIAAAILWTVVDDRSALGEASRLVNGVVVHNAAGYQTVRVATGDTLRYSVPAGQVFITVLPDSTGIGKVQQYQNLRVPARSWRTGRAFFWQTRVEDNGEQYIRFLARNFSLTDTLTLVINVLPQ